MFEKTYLILCVITVLCAGILSWQSMTSARTIASEWDTSQLEIIAQGEIHTEVDCYGVATNYLGNRKIDKASDVYIPSGSIIELQLLPKDKPYVLAKFKTFPANFFFNLHQYAIKAIDCNEEK